MNGPFLANFVRKGPLPSSTAVSRASCSSRRRAPADRFEYEDRDLAVDLALVVGIVRKRVHRPVPPESLLVSEHFARSVLVGHRAVLEFDDRLGEQARVPLRVGWLGAIGRDSRVAALVLDAHHRCLADLAGLGASVGHQYQGPVLHRDAVGRAGAHDLLDMLAHELQRARFVVASHRLALTAATRPCRRPCGWSGRLVSTLPVKVLRMPGSTATVSAGRPVTVSSARAHHRSLIWSASALPLSVSSTMLARLSDGAVVRRMWPETSSLRVMSVTLGGSQPRASLSWAWIIGPVLASSSRSASCPVCRPSGARRAAALARWRKLRRRMAWLMASACLKSTVSPRRTSYAHKVMRITNCASSRGSR